MLYCFPISHYATLEVDLRIFTVTNGYEINIKENFMVYT
jgi:hypothetical protein